MHDGQTKDQASKSSFVERASASGRLEALSSSLFDTLSGTANESITLSQEDDFLHVSVNRDKLVVHETKIPGQWLENLNAWLYGRRLTLLNQDNIFITAEDTPGEFMSLTRTRGEICFFRVKRVGGKAGKKQLRISDLLKLTEQDFWKRLNASFDRHKIYSKMLADSSGVILISSPDQENLARAVALNLALSKATVAVEMGAMALRVEIEALAKLEPVIVYCKADDPVEALLQFRAATAGEGLLPKYSLTQGFVRAVCPSCGREALPDKNLMSTLPSELQFGDEGVYKVGRGCARCGHTGYCGYLGIQTLAEVDESLETMLRGQADQKSLVSHTSSCGVRSLFEEGIRGVRSGLVTFESLFKLTRTVPIVYLKHLKSLKESKTEKAERLEVSDHFFDAAKNGGELNVGTPLSGKAAFNPNNLTADSHDKPLFEKQVKNRPNPLILVVEDDPDQRSILEMVLKSARYEVLAANDGIEALDRLKGDLPDLIMTDVMMPNMDGIELVTKLKNDNQLRQIPILVLTVLSDSEKEYALLDLGADDYCEKTVQRKILLKRVEKLLKRTKNR